MPYLEMRLENAKITSYSISGDSDGSFNFDLVSEGSTTLPGGDSDGRDFLAWQRSLGPAANEADDPLGDFVVTKSLDKTSFHYDGGFTGGVVVAAGDVDHTSYNPYVTVDYVDDIL
jgi:hypothetical protein